MIKRLPGTLHGLDWLNFFLADVQTGIVGPFLAIYLAAYTLQLLQNLQQL